MGTTQYSLISLPVSKKKFTTSAGRIRMRRTTASMSEVRARAPRHNPPMTLELICGELHRGTVYSVR